eukprot:160214-Amphidinium_carterae.1
MQTACHRHTARRRHKEDRCIHAAVRSESNETEKKNFASQHGEDMDEPMQQELAALLVETGGAQIIE